MSSEEPKKNLEDEVETSYDPVTNTFFFNMKDRKPIKTEYVHTEKGTFEVSLYREKGTDVFEFRQVTTTEMGYDYFLAQQAYTHPHHRENPEDASNLFDIFRKG